jgi:hypothetical protein
MTNRLAWLDSVETLIATFGVAQLVQTPGGRFELRGGTLNDYQEAKEWCSLFMPEAVIWKMPVRSHRCAA